MACHELLSQHRTLQLFRLEKHFTLPTSPNFSSYFYQFYEFYQLYQFWGDTKKRQGYCRVTDRAANPPCTFMQPKREAHKFLTTQVVGFPAIKGHKKRVILTSINNQDFSRVLVALAEGHPQNLVPILLQV